jgi:hypothetical protein
MAFQATVFDVLIASPKDVPKARGLAEHECHDWTGSRAREEGVVLRPRRHETDSVPLINGSDPQSIINVQLVREADIVIAIFHSRVGTRTPRAISGTVEELTAAAAAGKPVHVYFSRQGHPNNVDPLQIAAVRELQRQLSHVGLTAEYTSFTDLHTQVRRALDYDVNRLRSEAEH